jgi:hypothetical protein
LWHVAKAVFRRKHGNLAAYNRKEERPKIKISQHKLSIKKLGEKQSKQSK